MREGVDVTVFYSGGRSGSVDSGGDVVVGSGDDGGAGCYLWHVPVQSGLLLGVMLLTVVAAIMGYTCYLVLKSVDKLAGESSPVRIRRA